MIKLYIHLTPNEIQCIPVDVGIAKACSLALRRRFAKIIVTNTHAIRRNATAATTPSIIGNLLFLSSTIDPPDPISNVIFYVDNMNMIQIKVNSYKNNHVTNI